MLLNAVQFCILFAALFITAYLLSTLVDFEADGRGVSLADVWAKILFPFYKGRRFNCTSVILQASNYIFAVLYIIGELFKDRVDIIAQAIFTALYMFVIILTIIIVQHRMTSKSKKSKGDIK